MLKIKIIKEPFKNEDGALVMFPFRKGLRIEEYYRDKKLLFLLRDDKFGYKNEYLNDERREKFPYSNIPVFNTIKGLHIYKVANQILNYNQIYLVKYYKEDYVYDGTNTSESHKEILEDTELVSVINDDDPNSDKAYMVISDKRVPELELNAKELKNLITLKQVELEQMKEPYIPTLLNKGITKDDVKKAKRLVKEKRS